MSNYTKDIRVGGLNQRFPRETMIKSVRVELVETRVRQIKGFDKLSPNGGAFFSVSLDKE